MNAWLMRPVSTRWGIYSAGMPVRMTVLPDGRVFICFDGFHVTGVCHCAVCPASTVSTT